MRHLIARHVGVPVQHYVHARRRVFRRDVLQKKTHAFALQRQLQRPKRFPLVVAQHDVQGLPELLEFHERLGLAHVAEMPDLVRVLQTRRQIFRVFVVGV